jgi:hypothetical protein
VSIAFSLAAIVISVAAYVGYRGLWDKRDLSEFTETLLRLERVVDRIETATSVAAIDMATARTATEHVAADLLASQHRADTVVNGHPGEAADASAQSEK